MLAEMAKAAAPTTAPKDQYQTQSYNQPEPGICDICKQGKLQLYVMAVTGDLVCPECYQNIYLEADHKARTKVQEAVETLEISEDSLCRLKKCNG